MVLDLRSVGFKEEGLATELWERDSSEDAGVGAFLALVPARVLLVLIWSRLGWVEELRRKKMEN